MLKATTRESALNNAKTSIWYRLQIAHGLMNRHGQDFKLGEGEYHKSHVIASSEIFEKMDFLWDKD